MPFLNQCVFYGRSFYDSLLASHFHSWMCPSYMLLHHTFDHDSDLCLQHARLKANIENNIEMTFNSMEHIMDNMFNLFSELVYK